MRRVTGHSQLGESGIGRRFLAGLALAGSVVLGTVCGWDAFEWLQSQHQLQISQETIRELDRTTAKLAGDVKPGVEPCYFESMAVRNVRMEEEFSLGLIAYGGQELPKALLQRKNLEAVVAPVRKVRSHAVNALRQARREELRKMAAASSGMDRAQGSLWFSTSGFALAGAATIGLKRRSKREPAAPATLHAAVSPNIDPGEAHGTEPVLCFSPSGHLQNWNAEAGRALQLNPRTDLGRHWRQIFVGAAQEQPSVGAHDSQGFHWEVAGDSEGFTARASTVHRLAA